MVLLFIDVQIERKKLISPLTQQQDVLSIITVKLSGAKRKISKKNEALYINLRTILQRSLMSVSSRNKINATINPSPTQA